MGKSPWGSEGAGALGRGTGMERGGGGSVLKGRTEIQEDGRISGEDHLMPDGVRRIFRRLRGGEGFSG